MHDKSMLYRIATGLMIVVLMFGIIPIQSAKADTAGFSVPTIYSNSTLLNAANAYASDDQYVQTNGSNKSAEYGNFGFNIPTGATINLVEVSIEGHGNKNWKVAVSTNSGANYSAFTTITNTPVDTVVITGGTGTLWGLTGWTSASLNNANFRVKVASAGGNPSKIGYLDQLQVRVSYTPAGLTTTTLVVSAPSVGTYGGSTNLQATLKTSTGLPLSNKTITFTLDGYTKDTATTNGSGVATLSNVSLATGLSNTLLNVGSYVVGASFAGDTSYGFSNDTDTQVINPRGVTVTVNAKSKAYGSVDPALTYSFAPALLGTDSFTGSLARAAGENVGTYAITQGTLAINSNYSITYVGANLTITPFAITVTADDKAMKAGNPDPTYTFNVSAFVGSDAFTTSPTCSASGNHNNTGTFSIVCAGGNAGSNYSITYVNGTLTVTNKYILTVTANPQSINYGDADPTFTFAYSGFVDGDTDITGTAPTCTLAVPHTNAGSYPSIICSGGSDTKYAFSFTSGTLTVHPLGITVTAAAQAKTYGSADPTFNYDFAPALIGADTFTGALSRAAGENVGTYAINQGSLALNSNYAITFVSADLTINQATLNVTADDQTIEYGSADPVFTFQYDGFVNNEDASVIDTAPTCGVTGDHTSLGAYSINCSGGSDNNYSFSFFSGTLTVQHTAFFAADFNGDHKTDVAVFRPSDGKWYLKGVGSFLYGQAGDIPVPADYNGDGKTDIAVFRPSNSTWYIQGIGSFVYGQAGDIPVVADYNGDKIADIAVFRPSNSTWYIRGVGGFVYGKAGDIPVVADYDGDGKADIAVFRPTNSTWYIYKIGPRVYGTVGDIPVVADYDGDGKADIAVFRPSNSTWYIYGVGPKMYGTVGDTPVIGDYNGDGKADVAVFRSSNSTWYIYGVGPSVYGTTGDIPV